MFRSKLFQSEWNGGCEPRILRAWVHQRAWFLLWRNRRGHLQRYLPTGGREKSNIYVISPWRTCWQNWPLRRRRVQVWTRRSTAFLKLDQKLGHKSMAPWSIPEHTKTLPPPPQLCFSSSQCISVSFFGIIHCNSNLSLKEYSCEPGSTRICFGVFTYMTWQ